MGYKKISQKNKLSKSSIGCFAIVLIILAIIFFSLFNYLNDERDLDGIELFTLSNHPQYGDSFEEAKEFYKDYIDNNIVYFSGNYQKYRDGITVIAFDGVNLNNSDEKIINNIELYFKNTETGTLNLDNSLEIIEEYLPADIIQKNYAFDRSYIIEDIDSEKTDTYTYIIHYQRLDSSAVLSSDIYIMLYAQDNTEIVNYAVISNKISNGYDRYRQNSLQEKEWNYDSLIPNVVPVSTTELITESETTTKTETTAKAETTTKEATTTKAQTTAVLATTKAAENTTAKKVTEQSTKVNTNQSGEYILNTKTGKYHYSSCYTLKSANSENLTKISFDEAKNYSPCQKCNPPS